jgi:hypothetical protein
MSTKTKQITSFCKGSERLVLKTTDSPKGGQFQG